MILVKKQRFNRKSYKTLDSKAAKESPTKLILSIIHCDKTHLFKAHCDKTLRE